jgi:hypothetical protein
MNPYEKKFLISEAEYKKLTCIAEEHDQKLNVHIRQLTTINDVDKLTFKNDDHYKHDHMRQPRRQEPFKSSSSYEIENKNDRSQPQRLNNMQNISQPQRLNNLQNVSQSLQNASQSHEADNIQNVSL